MTETTSTPIHNDPANNTRFYFIVGCMVFISLWFIGNSFIRTGWATAAFLTFLVYGALWTFGGVKKDQQLLMTLTFATVAGFVELAADAWLIHSIKILVYDPNGPFIASSPLYMPFSWAVVLTLLAQMGRHLSLRLNMTWAVIITAVCGGLMIPLAEYGANGAGWWYYVNPDLPWMNTPSLIVMGEIMIAAVLPPLLKELEIKPNPLLTLTAGILLGLWIWGAYYIGYLISM